ncbi:hypothetical protein KR026_012424 [Drosophila bipectinata]|nr:hypothetical protein KR026_012424 [Drosophila bipectinata]
MKYFAVFLMVLCFLGATLAQRKNPICAEEFAVRGGPCRGLIPSWSYNQASGECEPFNYNGCHGSKNRFDNQEDCEKNCKPQIL